MRKHTVHLESTQQASVSEKTHCSLRIHTAGLCEWENPHTVHLESTQQASVSETSTLFTLKTHWSTQQASVSEKIHCSLRIHTAGFCEWENTLFTEDPPRRSLWVRKHTVHCGSTWKASMSEKAHCSLSMHTAGLCEWEIHCSLRIHTAGFCEWENTLFT